MRKLTSILAFLLIISLLFTGCNNFPFPSTTPTEPQTIRQDYEHYGFSFEIAGSITEEEGNKYGQAAFKTNLGQFVFWKQDIPASSDIQNSHQVAIKFAEDNFLNNVDYNFVSNNETARDIVMNQNVKGQIKRNTNVVFTVSLGDINALGEYEIDDYSSKSLSSVLLKIKRNGIKYDLRYDYSKSVKKDYIIEQSIKEGTKVKPNSDVIILTVSYGKEVKVPSFNGKSQDDVLSWISANNLKVEFEEKHHISLEKGKLIGINYNKGDIISEGTKIIITTSLGPIIVPSFTSLAHFRSWCDENKIKYEEKYEYSTAVAKGNIIKTSVILKEFVSEFFLFFPMVN